MKLKPLELKIMKLKTVKLKIEKLKTVGLQIVKLRSVKLKSVKVKTIENFLLFIIYEIEIYLILETKFHESYLFPF